MKHYIFKINNKSEKKVNNTNASEILDSIIANSLKNKNKYLFNTKENLDNVHIEIKKNPKVVVNNSLKTDVFDLIEAAHFLANYKELPVHKFKLRTLYKLYDGTPIMFYEDEVQIGYDIYKYKDFDNIDFLNALTQEKKKAVINIHIKL